MNMKKAKLNLKALSIMDLVAFARNIVVHMTGNVNFTTPVPALIDVTNAADALENAYLAAQNSGKAETSFMYIKTDALKDLLVVLSEYVNNIAKGDVTIIYSSGMDVTKDREPIGMLPAPSDVRLFETGNEGEVEVRFSKVNGASSYAIFMFEEEIIRDTSQLQTDVQPTGSIPDGGQDDPSGLDISLHKWSQTAVSTKTKYVITGLTLGYRIFVRVAAIGAAGMGVKSDPATRIVP
jgi:hypothetical protein